MCRPRHRQQGQVDGLHPPAMMLEHPLERRRAVDVADQADRRRVEIGGNGHALLLGRVDDRLDRQVIVQRLAASPVDVPDGRADLRVAVPSMSSSRKSISRPSRCRTARTRRSGPVGVLVKSGSTRAAKSDSVSIRQNARSARPNRFNFPTSSMPGNHTRRDDPSSRQNKFRLFSLPIDRAVANDALPRRSDDPSNRNPRKPRDSCATGPVQDRNELHPRGSAQYDEIGWWKSSIYDHRQVGHQPRG